MIKLEKTEIYGWEAAIRGMRNPMNSWSKSDSEFDDFGWCMGRKDFDLMKQLDKAGIDHRKFMRMLTVSVDIVAPLYWWKEFKTYTKGRIFCDDELDCMEDRLIDSTNVEPHIIMNSCSTMHKIQAKEFTMDDFSTEHLISDGDEFGIEPFMADGYYGAWAPQDLFEIIIDMLNMGRQRFLETKDKRYWWQMIQLLPSSYNQRRTVQLNYEVLANIYHARKNHKLDEWRDFCKWIKTLLYSELITGEFKDE